MEEKRSTIETKNRTHKVIDLKARGFKELDGENGGLAGVANATGFLDDGNDICAAGSFIKNAPFFLENGWIAPDHTWGYKDAVGFPTNATENEQGFYIETVFHPTPDAQAIRQKVMHRLAQGKTVKFSIGYDIIDFEMMPGKKAVAYLTNPTPEDIARCEATPVVRVLKELKIFEVSLVSVPMNANSFVTQAKGTNKYRVDNSGKGFFKGGLMITDKKISDALKSGNLKALFEDAIEESNESFYFLTNTLWRVLWQIRQKDEAAEVAGLEYNLEGELRAALAEFTERVVSSMIEEDTEEDTGQTDDGGQADAETEEDLDDSEEEMEEGDDPADKSGERGERKESRTLSMSTRKAIKAHVKALDSHTKGLQKASKELKTLLTSADAGKVTDDEEVGSDDGKEKGMSTNALRAGHAKRKLLALEM